MPSSIVFTSQTPAAGVSSLSLSISSFRASVGFESQSRVMGSSAESFPLLQEIMLEFRAGKMFIDGTKVTPDNRKGIVRIGRGEEGLVHFQWLDRSQNTVEDDQIIFPEEAVFEKVGQSSGRVYVLKFNSDSRRFFFWMQEPKSDGDSQVCNSVNYYINQPLELIGDEEPEASVPLQISEMSDDTAEDEISSRAGDLVRPNSVRELSNEVTSSSGPVLLVDLQRILSNISQTDAAADQDGGLGLGDILKPDLLRPLIEAFPLEQCLTSYLPDGPWTTDDLMELLQSTPFRQQVESFNYVLRTGQIDLSQFGINPSKYKFTVLSFLEALEDTVADTSDSNEAQSRKNESKGSPSERHSGGDSMDEGL